jgi:hypothetical protein
MHLSPQDVPYEYKLVSMGNPLQPDTELRANALGRLGWDLAAIDAGVWVFKRRLNDEPATPLQALMEATVPLGEPETGVSMTSTVSPT